MNEEKRVNGKDVIKLLLGNKWLYLIMVAVFFIASFVGLNLISSSRKQYVAFFDYDVAGFKTISDEEGNKTSYFIDGEKFDTRDAITKEKINNYITTNPNLVNLEADKMTSRNIVASFEYTTRYKENDHKMDDKDAAFIEDKKGYELVLESYGLDDFEARVLCECIANEVIEVTKTKIDSIDYSSYIMAYDRAKSYPEKIGNLVSGIENLVNLSNDLKAIYGDVVLVAGNYGGDESKYHLDKLSISAWQNQMKSSFDNYYVGSLSSELEVNGYIAPEFNDYIVSLNSAVENLNREITVNEAVLNDLKSQRDALVASVGTQATVESLEIREYNTEIIALTKQIADQKEQVDKYQLQLEKLDTSSFSPDQLAAYNANLTAFEEKLDKIRTDLVFYTDQYEGIAKKILKDNLRVYYDTSEVVTTRGEINSAVIFASSCMIGVIVPMLCNLVFAGFNVAEGRPLINFKKNKEQSFND